MASQVPLQGIDLRQMASEIPLGGMNIHQVDVQIPLKGMHFYAVTWSLKTVEGFLKVQRIIYPSNRIAKFPKSYQKLLHNDF